MCPIFTVNVRRRRETSRVLGNLKPDQFNFPVVLANSNLIDTLRVDLPLFSRHISCAIGRLCCVVGLSSQPCKPSVGGVGSAPSTHRYAAVCETSEADPCGPVPVGMVGGNSAGLAFRADYRETRDGHRLAPKRLPSLLDVEIPSWPSRSSERAGRNTPTDSQDEPREPAVGRTTHPRGTP